MFHMEEQHTTRNGFISVIEGRRIATKRTYRDLADESLIPLTTLHRKMQTGDFTIAEIARLAVVFNTTVSQLMAEAEAA